MLRVSVNMLLRNMSDQGVSRLHFYLSMYVPTHCYRSGDGLHVGLLQQKITYVVT